MSAKPASMLGALPIGYADRMFSTPGMSLKHHGDNFRQQRKRIAHKLKNPRDLRIAFNTFRHRGVYRIRQNQGYHLRPKLLGHKSLKNTLRYTQLVALPQNEEYICKVAETVDGTKDLVEAGFEYVTSKRRKAVPQNENLISWYLIYP